MDGQEVLRILSAVGAMLTNDHFVSTSGKHTSSYVNKDALYPHTLVTERLCRHIATQLMHHDIEVVVGPAVGAVILAYGVARNLTELTSREVLCAYAEKTDDGGFTIKRGYDRLIRDKRVLVVEDVLTTGESVRKVVQTIRTVGGEVVAIAALCNRGEVTANDLADVPELFSLVNVPLDAWDEAECPLCAQGVPVNVDVGKGREFLARRQ
jgi:orotate phosphoribosyltransferase